MKLLRNFPLWVVSVVIAGSLSSCKRGSDARAEAEWWTLEGERAELAARVEILRMRVEAREEDSTKRAAVKLAHRTARDACAALEARAAELKAELPAMEAALERSWSEALADRRARQAGREIPVLRCAEGREFTQVHVIRVSEAGIEFHHATGIARLTADDLTAGQHEEFGIDAARAQDVIAAEHAATREYHRQVDIVSARTREKERREAAAEAQRRPAPVIAANTWNPTGLGSARRLSPLSESPRSFGRSRNVYTTIYGGYYPVYSTGNRSTFTTRPFSTPSNARYGPQSPSLQNTRFALPAPPRITTPSCPSN